MMSTSHEGIYLLKWWACFGSFLGFLLLRITKSHSNKVTSNINMESEINIYRQGIIKQLAETKLFWNKTGYTYAFTLLLKTISIKRNMQDSHIDLFIIYLFPIKFQRF